ncbi:MAG: hypothetical protein CM1200mP30_25600 [Pseudomonadota bacterium]|nr:MAG: hypothetical protein CM1200mP30_25600 [Pseudomonadota bacterium]
MALEKSGRGKGSEVVLIDKQGPGAGATGWLAVYPQPYMTGPLHAFCGKAKVWESDPVNFGFQQVGYVSVGNLTRKPICHAQQEQIESGYPSDLYVGKDAAAFLKSIWPTSELIAVMWSCTRSLQAMQVHI